jgi:protein MAK11
MIRIFHLLEGKEMGGVLENLGSVNMLEACKSHTLTGSEQGRVSIWRNKDWTNLHTFKGHRSSVSGLALHPSARLAISTGKDKRLILWNLVKARPSFKCKLDVVLEDLQWSKCGLFYLGHTDREVRIFSVESNLREDFVVIDHSSPIVAADFLGSSNFLFLADLNGEVVLHCLNKGSITFNTCSGRLSKVVSICTPTRTLLITTSTQGQLKIWNVSSAITAFQTMQKKDSLKIENSEEMIVFQCELNCRVSALTAVISNS